MLGVLPISASGHKHRQMPRKEMRWSTILVSRSVKVDDEYVDEERSWANQ